MKLRTKLLTALGFLAVIGGAAIAQTNFQFPNTPWQAYAPTRVQCGKLTGANMNVTTDQPIVISVPSGAYFIDSIVLTEPSISMTTAQGGFYTAASKGGVAIVASSQAYSAMTTTSANATGNGMAATLATAASTTKLGGYLNTSPITSLYFSLTTPQGAAATSNIRVYCRTLY
jgi:uncharacterized membrane protein